MRGQWLLAVGHQFAVFFVLIPCPILQLHHVFASGNLHSALYQCYMPLHDHAEMCQHEMIILLPIEMWHSQFGLRPH